MILKEVQRIMLSEKAKSRAQQRFFGMVRAAQKGEMKNPSSEVVDAADSMKVSDVKKFAKTKHKGLPEKKEVKEGMKEYEALKKEIHSRESGSRLNAGDEERKKRKREKNKRKKERKKARLKVEREQQKTTKPKKRKFETPKARRRRIMRGDDRVPLKDVNKPAEKQSIQRVGGSRGVHTANRKSKAAQGKPAPVVYSYKKKEQVNEIAPAIAMAGKALLSGGVKKAAVGAVKQKAKQAVKQKAAEVAGNVADKISKPIGGTRVQESKGTAELAGLALRGKKRCAHCGSFTHVTGQCPKKDHGVVNKRTITSEAKEEEGRSDYGKASVRNKRRFGKEGKPAIFDPTNERGKMIDKRREEHQQRQAKSGVTEGVMDIVRKYTDKKKPEKKAEKAMDAGARAKRQLARKVHAKYVSGSEDNVPDDIRDHKTWSDFRKHI